MPSLEATSAKNLIPFSTGQSLPTWKRLLDVLGCLAALPFLVPLVVLMLVITRLLAPGPVLFRQTRVGLHGRQFTMFKFRTMKAGVSVAAHQAHALDFIKNNRPMVKMDDKGDDRLIPLGRILRATGLDELPQVFNVLRGDMSLVGPRPCLPYEYDAYQPWQKERFHAMPGLTGLWQVSGKNRLSFDEMIHLDIRYARDLSCGQDLTIIARTIPALVTQVMDTRRARTAATTAAAPTPQPAPLSVKGAEVMERDARRKLYQFRLASDTDADRCFSRRKNA